jgi:AbrB family looped-hinge helix DNA binding protein
MRGLKLEIEATVKDEVVVTKKGQTTIPVKFRKKYGIEEGTRLQVLDTAEGILLKPKKCIWDMIGAFADYVTDEELKIQLDKLRHEDE